MRAINYTPCDKDTDNPMPPPSVVLNILHHQIFGEDVPVSHNTTVTLRKSSTNVESNETRHLLIAMVTRLQDRLLSSIP